MEPATKIAIPGTMQAATMTSFHGLDDPEYWVMERKLDGFRLLCVQDGDTLGYSRAHNDQRIDLKLPHVYHTVQQVLINAGCAKFTVIDGELTTANDNFSHVAGVMKSLPVRARQLQGIDEAGDFVELVGDDRRLHYAVFDVLFWNGTDVRDLPLTGRRSILEPHLSPKSRVYDDFPVYLTDWHVPNEDVVAEWMVGGGEGAIVKNLLSPYTSYKRPPRHWYKYKAEGESDVVVMGFTEGREGKGVRRMTDTVGAICFGQYTGESCPACEGDPGDGCEACFGVGRELRYRGQVSGMDDALRFGFRDRARGIDTTREYYGKVMVIRHNLIARDGFRHPRFLHFRDDKPLSECVWETR